MRKQRRPSGSAAHSVLFVYGSLLMGEVNHAQLTGARKLADALTEARFELVDLGPYPALVRGGATSVAGELYEVTARLLAALDAFEGHPDLYRRERIRLADGREVGAYLYDAERAQPYPRIASGRWRDRAQLTSRSSCST
jgi:gamma-glutamylcyclotransferase (GGCT)/AIG2-like uncharacterized protein YtfP